MPIQRLIIILLYIFCLVRLIIVGASFFDQLGCEGQFINVNLNPAGQQQIWGDQVIGQSFIAPWPNLNRVDILLQTYGRHNTHYVTMRLLEFSPNSDHLEDALERFKSTFNAATVTDQEWRTFFFPAITNSAGKTFVVVLQSPESEPGNAITVGGIDKDVYPGSAFLGSTPIPADITFRACFQMTGLEKSHAFFEQITHSRPLLWGNTFFYVLCSGIYSLLLIGFFWRLTKLTW